MILRTGKASIVMLTLSLVCTPAGYLFRWRDATTVRRPLGLYAFMYVCIHFLIFVWLDYALVPLIVEEIVAPLCAGGFAAPRPKGWQAAGQALEDAKGLSIAVRLLFTTSGW
jgi:DMSO/TMAO reductase YedYZ heme-binding membrane subunit